MAQAIFNDICSKRGLDFHASSAGVATVDGLTAQKLAVDTMAQRGIDITDHRTRFLPNVNLSNYDLFVTMDYDQATLVESLSIPREYIKVLQKPQTDKYDMQIGIADPFGGDKNTYKKCADDMTLAIEDLIEAL